MVFISYFLIGFVISCIAVYKKTNEYDVIGLACASLVFWPMLLFILFYEYLHKLGKKNKKGIKHG